MSLAMPTSAIHAPTEVVPTAEGAVYAVASADPAVNAFLGRRIYRNAATEGAEQPYAVLTRIDGVRGQLMGGSDGLVRSRVQLDLYDSDELRIAKAAEALRLALGSFRGVAAGLTVRRISLEDSGSSAERRGDGSDALDHRERMDFIVIYQELATTLST